MTVGYMPNQLPVSCLTMVPRFDSKANQSIIAGPGPLMELNNDVKGRTLKGIHLSLSLIVPNIVQILFVADLLRYYMNTISNVKLTN